MWYFVVCLSIFCLIQQLYSTPSCPASHAHMPQPNWDLKFPSSKNRWETQCESCGFQKPLCAQPIVFVYEMKLKRGTTGEQFNLFFLLLYQCNIKSFSLSNNQCSRFYRLNKHSASTFIFCHHKPLTCNEGTPQLVFFHCLVISQSLRLLFRLLYCTHAATSDHRSAVFGFLNEIFMILVPQVAAQELLCSEL